MISHKVFILTVSLLFLSGCSSGIEDEQDQLTGGGKASRIEPNIVVRYDFNEGGGAIVHDSSKLDSPLDLTINDVTSVEWKKDSLLLVAPSEITSQDANGLDARADKLYQYLEAENELSVEAWITPANSTQVGVDDPARIVAFSGDSSTQAFVLGQQADQWMGRVRTNKTAGYAGRPNLVTNALSVDSVLTHVVFTWSGFSRLMKVYINGELAAQLDRPEYIAGVDSTGYVSYVWDRSHSLRIGYERVAGGGGITDAWLGELHFMAIFAKALTADEVVKNFNAGPP